MLLYEEFATAWSMSYEIDDYSDKPYSTDAGDLQARNLTEPVTPPTPRAHPTKMCAADGSNPYHPDDKAYVDSVLQGASQPATGHRCRHLASNTPW